MVDLSKEAPKVYDHLFAVGERVMVAVQMQNGDNQNGWITLNTYTGTVTTPPSTANSCMVPSGLNIMPDVPLPLGNDGASIHPRVHNTDPFWQKLPEDRKVLLRNHITRAALDSQMEPISSSDKA